MIFALVIVAVVGMVGLVVDGARAYRTVGRMPLRWTPRLLPQQRQ